MSVRVSSWEGAIHVTLLARIGGSGSDVLGKSAHSVADARERRHRSGIVRVDPCRLRSPGNSVDVERFDKCEAILDEGVGEPEPRECNLSNRRQRPRRRDALKRQSRVTYGRPRTSLQDSIKERRRGAFTRPRLWDSLSSAKGPTQKKAPGGGGASEVEMEKQPLPLFFPAR